jgi:hypothetical protein
MEIDFLLLIVVGRNSIWIGVENGESLRELRSVTDSTSNERTVSSSIRVENLT